MSRITSHARIGRPSALDDPQVERAFTRCCEAKLGLHALAAQFRVSVQTVSYWKRQLGLSRTYGKRALREWTPRSTPQPELYRCVCGGLSTDPDSVDRCTHARGAA